MGRTLPNDMAAYDEQIVNKLAGEVKGALAYLRGAQGFGTITIRLTVRDGVVAMLETAPNRSLKPDYDYSRNC